MAFKRSGVRLPLAPPAKSEPWLLSQPRLFSSCQCGVSRSRTILPPFGPTLALPAFLRVVMRKCRRMGRGGPTMHSFRSCFREWCAEATAHPREVAKQALARALSDKVEAAYRRGDMLEKRRRLMEEWATFCKTSPAEATPRTATAW